MTAEFCTTAPYSIFSPFGEEDRYDEWPYTAPSGAFDGPRNISYIPERGHEVPCEPDLRGYITGKVEALAGFDIPTLCQGEVLVDRDEPVEVPCFVWTRPDNRVACTAVIWPTGEFVCWRNGNGWRHATAAEAHSFAGLLMAKEPALPEAEKSKLRVSQIFRYYIVSNDDHDSLKHARGKAAERSNLL